MRYATGSFASAALNSITGSGVKDHLLPDTDLRQEERMMRKRRREVAARLRRRGVLCQICGYVLASRYDRFGRAVCQRSHKLFPNW